jgi:FkbM family methyltransferase
MHVVSDPVIFIQIGSNEGVMSTDPLCALILKERWQGILIEPVPRIFEKLKHNYAGCPQLHFENVAISTTRKVCDFYVVDENAEIVKKNPHWTNEAGGLWGDLIGSLDREHVLRCKPALTAADIKTLQVQCVTLQDIIDKYQLPRVDVLHMDAESHDAEILLSIDFQKIKPKIILFEHIYMEFDIYFTCLHYLQSHGYTVLHTGDIDTVVGNPWT